jgi:hypothetical protein
MTIEQRLLDEAEQYVSTFNTTSEDPREVLASLLQAAEERGELNGLTHGKLVTISCGGLAKMKAAHKELREAAEAAVASKTYHSTRQGMFSCEDTCLQCAKENALRAKLEGGGE